MRVGMVLLTFFFSFSFELFLLSDGEKKISETSVPSKLLSLVETFAVCRQELTLLFRHV